MKTCTFNEDRTAVIVSDIGLFWLDPEAETPTLAPLPHLHSEEEAEGFELAAEFLRQVEWSEKNEESEMEEPLLEKSPKPGPFLVPGDALPPADPPVDVFGKAEDENPYKAFVESPSIGAAIAEERAKAAPRRADALYEAVKGPGAVEVDVRYEVGIGSLPAAYREFLEEDDEPSHEMPVSDEDREWMSFDGGARPADETVDHPAHYGGDNDYEAIKVMEAWHGPTAVIHFCVLSAEKYLSRAGKKPNEPLSRDLRKAAWYLNHAAALSEKSEE